MHEYGITNEVVHRILHECEDKDIKQPKKILVELGELTSYKKESVLFYFENFKKENEILRNATLEIKMIKGRIKCNNCKKESVVEPSPIYLCPSCESVDVEVLQGNSIDILDIR